MKKISIGKIIFLVIITLGIYGTVWLAKRRSELIKKTKARIPHWIWLILTSIITLGLLLPVLFTSVLIFGEDYGAVAKTMLVFMIIMSVIAYAVSIWWIHQFNKAAAIANHGKTPPTYMTLLFATWALLVIFVHQHYFNNLDDKDQKPGPTENFKTGALVMIIIGFISMVSGTVNLYASFNHIKDFMREETSKAQESESTKEALFQKTEDLAKDYDDCVARLEEDFPGDLTEENEDDYKEAEDACEEIRKEQNRAVDEYEALTKSVY